MTDNTTSHTDDSTTTNIALEKYERNVTCAIEAKTQGNAALQEGKLKTASFHYKRVYLYLAEYLPDLMVPHYYQKNKANNENGDITNLLGGGENNPNSKQKQKLNYILSHVLSAEQKAKNVHLHITTLNNLVLVDAKLGRYRESRDGASDVIAFSEFYLINNENKQNRDEWEQIQNKARLRRAHANLMLADYDAVKEDVRILEEEKHFHDSALENIKEQIKQRQTADKQKEKKMAQRMFQ